MQVHVVRPDELSDAERQAWRTLCRTSPVDSPFLRPEYTAAVHAVRGDVHVGVVERSGEIVGILPFQRRSLGRGVPVAARLSDLQGGVFRSDVEIDPVSVVRGCGLSSWTFDRVVGLPRAESHTRSTEESPYLDLRTGYDEYCAERAASGSRQVKETERKRRKFEREVGPIGFVLDADDDVAFDLMVGWKNEQHDRVGSLAVFRQPWVLDLVTRLRGTRTPEFAGVLSVLRHEDRVLAVHFGLRTETVLHWWFPTYEAEFGKYSPGNILLLDVANTAAADGVERIDLGTGDERYKQSFKSGDLVVRGGSFDSGSIARFTSSAGRRMREAARHPRLRGGVSLAKQAVRGLQSLFTPPRTHTED